MLLVIHLPLLLIKNQGTVGMSQRFSNRDVVHDG